MRSAKLPHIYDASFSAVSRRVLNNFMPIWLVQLAKFRTSAIKSWGGRACQKFLPSANKGYRKCLNRGVEISFLMGVVGLFMLSLIYNVKLEFWIWEIYFIFIFKKIILTYHILLKIAIYNYFLYLFFLLKPPLVHSPEYPYKNYMSSAKSRAKRVGEKNCLKMQDTKSWMKFSKRKANRF